MLGDLSYFIPNFGPLHLLREVLHDYRVAFFVFTLLCTVLLEHAVRQVDQLIVGIHVLLVAAGASLAVIVEPYALLREQRPHPQVALAPVDRHRFLYLLLHDPFRRSRIFVFFFLLTHFDDSFCLLVSADDLDSFTSVGFAWLQNPYIFLTMFFFVRIFSASDTHTSSFKFREFLATGRANIE